MIANRPKATMRDVAEEAGVSKALVSLVYRTPEKVSPERRAWVLEAAERLGFRPNWVASSLSARESSFTAILVSNMHNPVFGTVVDSARATLAEAGRYGLMSSAVIPGPDGVFQADHRIVNALEDLNAGGFLVVGVMPDWSVLRDIHPSRRVVVALAAIDEIPRAASVRSHNVEGMRELIAHLTSQGHTRIAHLGGLGQAAGRARAAAYEAAMREAGLERHIRVVPADFSEDSGRAAAGLLLDRYPDTTAVTCVNDLVALGAMSAVRATGRAIPDDVALAGYDNTFLAGLDAI
ncbi:MAG TPA: LacI family DNA-binding transcriptional regulator, partial [Arachnia sp.]|nr:LacI family DNA-binding transcriptional regulator [Arachnia sp.]